uniref:hypothetical protein n=1 Tax=Jatropha curcas TaxID=180498 RepID=UPI0027A34FFA|nr:hypothetical protein QLP06_mgp108 [Jatropha curcas]WFG81131.1 hypothetical protein [Jatropha curcas]
MNRSYFRVRVRTSISPYRGSTCYKRRTSPFQNIHIGPQAGIEKEGRKESIYPYNIPECIMALSFHLFLKKKKSSGAGGTNRRGEEEEGGLRALSRCCSRTTHSFPGPVRSDEIRSLERSEVIGREDCWREISIHYTPLYSKGKTEVRSCAPAEGRSFVWKLIIRERGKPKPTPNKLLDRSRTFSIRPPAAEGVRFPLYAMWRKRLIQLIKP